MRVRKKEKEIWPRNQQATVMRSNAGQHRVALLQNCRHVTYFLVETPVQSHRDTKLEEKINLPS